MKLKQKNVKQSIFASCIEELNRGLYSFLIFKATKDLDELDKQRREEFKNYELEKEHERREHLKELPEEERKKEEQKYDEMKKKHRDHPKLHHPVRLSIDKIFIFVYRIQS